MDISGLFDDEEEDQDSTNPSPQPGPAHRAEQSSLFYIECSKTKPTLERCKSRLCCLRFEPSQAEVPEGQWAADTLRGVVNEIEQARSRSSGSFGLPLKSATFFVAPGTGETWFVLVSRDALYMSKWNKVFAGLKAVAGRVHYDPNARVSASLLGVPHMFPGVTLAQLTENAVDCLEPVVSLYRFSPFFYPY